MAAEAVVSGATEILMKLIFTGGQHISLAWGFKKDLKKLKDTLLMIQAVITTAEKKQVNDEVVRLWLRRLKDIAYDADDILDRFSYEVMRNRKRGSIKKKVHIFLSRSSLPRTFGQKMAPKIKKINQRLDELIKDTVWLELKITTSVHQSSDEQRNHQLEPFLGDNLDIAGSRTNDKLKIINMLISNSSLSSSSSSISSGICNPNENVSVIPIVGMGGIGKSTVARLVYNDVISVAKHFHPRAWVSVSHDFDVIRILKDMIESITGRGVSDDASSKHLLLNRVRKLLNKKRYLLVLDDLWIENIEGWENFKSNLIVGAPGSKILITTRKHQVASIVGGTIQPYKLRQLSDGECWSIMKPKAFGPNGPTKTEKMVQIGKDIAKKCGGLPHVARTLGYSMRVKKKESEWVSIRESTIWDIPILKLSYDHLPSHLKQCFSYFSIFPKDVEIKRETLIQLWMAEDFLHQSESNDELEDIGNGYFNNFWEECFFQDEQNDAFEDIQKCKLHTLVHDLAKRVVDNHECSTIEVDSDEKKIDISKVRRLQLVFRTKKSLPKYLSNKKKLRTIVAIEARNCDNIESFFTNKHLRVLDASGSSIKKLPTSVARLRHLRYLDLSESHGFDVLHDKSICRLYNLQTLVLHNCNSLKRIPKKIGSLQNLRHLDLSLCTSIEDLPPSVTNLSNLRTLNLSQCTNFKGLPSNVGALIHLQFLDLSWCTSIDVLPPSITDLCNLRTLNLSHCTSFKGLPSNIGTLRHLQFLDLSWCTSIDVLPPSVTDLSNLWTLNLSQCTNFNELPSNIGALVHLRFLDVSHTKIRSLPDSTTSLHDLRTLKFNFCANLTTLPQGIRALNHLPSLDYSGTNIKISPGA